MKYNTEHIKYAIIGVICIIAASTFHYVIPSKSFEGINDIASWYLYSFSKKSSKSSKFIGIAIDDSSLSKTPQRWPWKRSIYARLLEILDKEGVNTVGIDFAFVGEAQDRNDDIVLERALKNLSLRVVLAYFFDYDKSSAVFPLESLRKSAYSIGMVNTPRDVDGRIRRLRGYVRLNDISYYSLAVQLAASFTNTSPQNVVSKLPLFRDSTFLVKYLLKPKDITKVSFYDVLENLADLKRKHGGDFLKDTLVIVYPEAEIFHDIQPTPIGKIPGGFLHLNGAANIILENFVEEKDFLLIVFLMASFAVILYLLISYGFLLGFLFTLGLTVINFWCFIFFNSIGIKFDFSRLVIFSLLFFTMGSLYRYIYFLSALLKIKNKATLDPLKNLFTLRYFYYRIELEVKKIYLRKNLFLAYIDLGSLNEDTGDYSLDRMKDIWHRISSALSLRGGFWSVHSKNGLVGCLISPGSKIESKIRFLKNDLQELLLEKDIKEDVRIGYARIKKSYPIRELIFLLYDGMKSKDGQVVLFKEDELDKNLSHTHLKVEDSKKLLESIDKDIEEKNSQLLMLVEELQKEQSKTKEAFFQIITSLINALEARDPYTEGHSERVCKYAMLLADKLGWSKEEKDKLERAALLHDLGKIGIPDSILHKKGKLSDEEYDFIKKHEIIGVKILEPLKDFAEILPWILYHHEWWKAATDHPIRQEGSEELFLTDSYN